MVSKYKKYAMPFEAWKNFKDKQIKMQETFKNVTGKERRIPLTQIIIASSKKPLWFDNDEVISFGKHKRGRK
jgi:hypothetical protein